MKTQVIESRLLNIENLLTGSKDVLNFNEVATYTGLSKSYLYKLTSSGMIPHYKPTGKMCYFKRTEVETWLLQNRRSTAEERSEAASTFVALKKKGAKK